MITVITNAKGKKARLDEFLALASQLTFESKSREGYISYAFNQSLA